MDDLEKPLVKKKLEPIDEENQLNLSDTDSILIVNDNLCKICFDQNEDIILPCKHKICKACLYQLNKYECPFCRAKFKLKSNPKIDKQSDCFCSNSFLNKICSLILLFFVIFAIYIENQSN
jgi:hypothetical protein